MSIIESRLHVIQNKVFTLKNVRDLAVIIWEEYLKIDDEIRCNSLAVSIGFTVHSFDHSSFTSANISIFNNDSIISKRRISSLEITFKDSRNENWKEIKFVLKHGNDDTDSNNYFEVVGNDNLWVNGIIGKFNEILTIIPNQYPIPKYQNIARLVFFSFTTYLFGAAVDLINRNNDNFVSYWQWIGLGDFIGKIVLAFFIGSLIGLGIIEKVIKYAHNFCPSIELQIAPDHLQTEKKKRKLLGVLITAFAIPVILTIISIIFG